MQDVPHLPELKVPKWPFFLGDAFMLGLAYYLFYWQAKFPLSQWEVVACALCVVLAAMLGILPYLLEYRAVIKYGALVKLIETSSLCAATEKIQNLESCVAQLGAASDQLQNAQIQADQTTNLARQIAERMAHEVKGFTEFMQKANESERATLRLEAEKLRRNEGEWLNVLVFMLDHIFALTKAAERSGQDNLIKQLAHFQAACRDAARRVGLVPVLAIAGESFDAQKHQLPEGETATAGNIVELMACGFSYQGRLLRRALVRLTEAANDSAPATAGEPQPQNQLPLGAGESAPA
jgi:molecular chaperone GrpE (heat shock protein)